jgi:hypothetical protein
MGAKLGLLSCGKNIDQGISGQIAEMSIYLYWIERKYSVHIKGCEISGACSRSRSD